MTQAFQVALGRNIPLSVSSAPAEVDLSDLRYLKIAGGVAADMISSDGAGNLVWSPVAGAGVFLELTGGTLTGALMLNGSPSGDQEAVSKSYVDGMGSNYLSISGGTLLGPLTLSADPASGPQAATKSYVDSQVSSGIPGASTTLPLMSGTALVGSGLTWARADHVHPSDTSRLALTGGGTVTGPVMATSVGFCDSNANKVPATLAFPTIAALKAFNPASISGQAIAHVANYSTVWDGGGGTFDWDSGCTNAQDNYAIVRSNYITGTAAGAWRRRMDPGNVTFEQAGARGDYDFASDTGTSDFTAIQAVLNYWSFVSGSLPAPVHGGVTVTLRPGRQYLVTGTINISRFMRILGSGWTYGVFDRNNPRYLSSGSGFVVDVVAGGAITLAQSNFVHGIQILRRGLLYNPTGAQVIAAYATWASTASVGLAALGLGCVIDNVIIVGFNTGITSLTAGQSARVVDCVIDCINGVEISGAGDRNWLVRVKCVPKYAGAVAGGDPDLTAARWHAGIGFNIHDRADTVILDQCESENWITGIRLSNVWGVRVNQPAIECTSTAGDTGILLQNVCSYVSIISPYINNAQFCIDCQATDQAHSTGSSSQTTSNVIIEGGDTNGNTAWTASGAHIRIGGSATGQISGMMVNNQIMPWLVVQAPTGTSPGNWLVRNISINEASNTWAQYVTVDPTMTANVRLSGIMRANSNTWIVPPAPDYVPIAGGVAMNGLLTLSGDPSAALGAATKQYVDAHTSGFSHTLYATGAPVGSGADTTEDTLQSYSLPGGTLANVGDRIRITAGGTFINNTDSKIARVRFGPSQFQTAVSSNASNTSWQITLEVQKTGANAQMTNSIGFTNAQSPGVGGSSSALNDTAAIAISATGQNNTNPTANSVTCRYFVVEYIH
jgi:hypothetical protein